MTRWVRPNPACEHNGGLMMWVRLMGGYHWQHCPLVGHRTLGTKYQLVREGSAGSSMTGLERWSPSVSPWIRVEAQTPTVLSTYKHMFHGCIHYTHLFRNRVLYLQIGAFGCSTLSAAPSVTQSCFSGTDFLCVRVCVFCGLITLWCSSFTPGVIHTPVRAEWTLTHGSESTTPLWLTV